MRLLSFALFLCFVFAPASAEWYLTHRDGIEEYDRGNLAAAYATYRRLAEGGDAESQNALAFMFYIGEGVSQDHAAAAAWFRRAAEQGLPTAQYNLGIMYANGHGVPRNDVEAHRWFALSEALARDEEERDLAKGNRNRIANRMAAAERATARKLVCDWWQGHGGAVDTPSPAPPACNEEMR